MWSTCPASSTQRIPSPAVDYRHPPDPVARRLSRTPTHLRRHPMWLAWRRPRRRYGKGTGRPMRGPSRRSTAHGYSSLQVNAPGHPPNLSPSGTFSPRSSWPHGRRRCSQTPSSAPSSGVLRHPWVGQWIELGSRWSRRPLDQRAAPFSCVVAYSIDAVRASRIACASQAGAVSAIALSENVMTLLSAGISDATKPPPWCGGWRTGRGRLAMLPRMFGLVIPVNARKRSMWGHAACSIRCRFRRDGVAPLEWIGSWVCL